MGTIKEKQATMALKKAIHEKAKSAFKELKKMGSGYDVALYYNGVDERNVYPYDIWGEPDVKTPKDWVNAIILHAVAFEKRDLAPIDFRVQKCKNSFTL